MANNSEIQKWTCALVCGLLFLIVSAPFTYDATNFVTSKMGFNTVETETDNKGRPTLWGLIIHMVVFVLLVRLSMFIPYDKLV